MPQPNPPAQPPVADHPPSGNIPPPPTGQPAPPATGEPGDNDPSGGEPAKTFTQEELDKIVATRVRKAETAAATKLQTDQGMTVAEVQALKAERDAADQAAMTEAQKAQAEAERLQGEAVKAAAEANEAKLKAQLREALLTQGEGDDDHPIRADRIDAAMALALPAALGSQDPEAVAEAVGQVRAMSPEWFGVPSSDGDGPSGNAQTPAPGRKAGERTPPKDTPQARASARLAKFREGRGSPMPTTTSKASTPE